MKEYLETLKAYLIDIYVKDILIKYDGLPHKNENISSYNSLKVNNVSKAAIKTKRMAIFR